MGKQIFDYDDKTFAEVTPDLDFLIITNGNEEYNISITELFKVHLHVTSHDHSQFTIESEVRNFARQEASAIVETAILKHENGNDPVGFDHTLFIDSAEAGLIADNHIAAYFPMTLTNIAQDDVLTYDATNERWINSQISVSGYTGTFTDHDQNVINVENGLITSVTPAPSWWNANEMFQGYDGTHYTNGSGWSFEYAS